MCTKNKWWKSGRALCAGTLRPSRVKFSRQTHRLCGTKRAATASAATASKSTASASRAASSVGITASVWSARTWTRLLPLPRSLEVVRPSQSMGATPPLHHLQLCTRVVAATPTPPQPRPRTSPTCCLPSCLGPCLPWLVVWEVGQKAAGPLSDLARSLSKTCSSNSWVLLRSSCSQQTARPPRLRQPPPASATCFQPAWPRSCKEQSPQRCRQAAAAAPSSSKGSLLGFHLVSQARWRLQPWPIGAARPPPSSTPHQASRVRGPAALV
mmetsp:Transcript_10642/g.29132  ORF Transcript_10642/g.29132 Transcript_10642/m.29132 type:complete len:269 (+) Transcript_10642:600-1406(+)